MSAASPRRVRTPVRLQMEAVECGAACLGIVLAHHGRWVPLPVLRRECGVSRDGSKASNVLKAARQFGLEARGFKKGLEELRTLPLPAVLFWNFNHFVVLEGFGKDRAYLNDPASGHRTVTLGELDECFTGVVLTFVPGPEFTPGGRPPSVVAALRRSLGGSRRALAFCVLAGLLLVTPGLALPVLTQAFVDHVLVQGRTDWLAPLLGIMAGAVALQALLQLLQVHHLRGLRLELAIRASAGFLQHVLRLPASYFAQRYSGELAGRLALNDRVARVLSTQLAQVGIDGVMLVFYAGLMLWYDPVLAGVGVAAALINVLTLDLVARSRTTANMRLLQERGKLGGVAVAGLQGMETLKAGAEEAGFFARWAGHHAKLVNAQQELALADQALGTVPALLSSFTAALVLCLGGVRVMDGALTIGMLVAFQLVLARFQRPVTTLLELGSTVQVLRGDLERLDDVLEHPLDPLPEAQAAAADAAGDGTVRLEGYLELEDVTFGYSPVSPPLIEGLSLRVTPGQRVALVGGSGSGKSTVAKLVCGLYRPWSGTIRLDGRPLEEVPRQVFANSVAMVEQDLFFFGGTVRDNVTLWDAAIEDEGLERACRDAHIHDVILTLPGGYGAELLEGAANLSGGQRQRLEIARALVEDPAILILDEATSALDAETERRIDRSLRLRGCTCLVIAHRLSTIRDCDEIVVLDEGKVVQRGTFEALVAQGGPFAELVRQGEGELALGAAGRAEQDAGHA